MHRVVAEVARVLGSPGRMAPKSAVSLATLGQSNHGVILSHLATFGLVDVADAVGDIRDPAHIFDLNVHPMLSLVQAGS